MLKMKDRMTYNEAIQKAVNILKTKEVADYKNDARLLCEFVFNRDRSFFLVHGDENADEDLLKDYFELVEKRANHIPLQQLTNEAWFMDYKFFVNEHVLIPRQDTEVLVEKAFELINEYIKAEKPQKLRLLDMCTGSGCIAISLYKMLEESIAKTDLEFVASDLSLKALEVAKKNAKDNGANIVFKEGNLFEAISSEEMDFDFIVSNPPYIEKKVIATLMPEVRDHEPISALDGGEDGLDFYRIIAKEATNNKSPFYLIFEIGYNQGEALKKIFKDNGYTESEILKDLAGLDRVALARYENI